MVVLPYLITNVSEKSLEYFVIGIVMAFPIVKFEMLPRTLSAGSTYKLCVAEVSQTLHPAWAYPPVSTIWKYTGTVPLVFPLTVYQPVVPVFVQPFSLSL